MSKEMYERKRGFFVSRTSLCTILMTAALARASIDPNARLLNEASADTLRGAPHFGEHIDANRQALVKVDLAKGCGPVSLYVASRLLGGIETTPEEITRLSAATPEGTSLDGLRKAATALGLHARPMRLTPEDLARLKHVAIVRLRLPVTRDPHLFCICGVRNNSLLVVDPPYPPYYYEIDDFAKYWTGETLVLSRKNIRVLDIAQSYRRRLMSSLCLVGLLGVVAMACALLYWRRAGKTPDLTADVGTRGKRLEVTTAVCLLVLVVVSTPLFLATWVRRSRDSQVQGRPAPDLSRFADAGANRAALGEPLLLPVSSTHNYGSVKSWRPIPCTFTLRNISDEEVRIHRVMAPCSCITSTPSKMQLAPGEDTEVAISFNPHGRDGAFRENLFVITATPSRQIVPLTVEGVVERDYRLLPTQLSLGPLDVGQERSASCVLHCQAEARASAVRATCAKPYVRCVAEPAGPDWKIHVTLLGTAPIGHLYEYVDVTIEGQDKYVETLSLPVVVTVEPIVAASPPILCFDSREHGSAGSEAIIQLRGRQGPLEISRIDAPEGIVIRTTARPDRSGCDLVAQLQGKSPLENAGVRQVVVHLGTPGQDRITLPVVIVR